ncbi:MAG: NADH-quinone oxidoreductase subunit NuoG [Limnobacter sp.]|nr:NADH-quinone oxidoreductase subunit NuoG [Limnobacter sp.]
MVELEIDGKKVEVVEGSMLMDAAQKAGSYVPHFCYHKKLSIAANCRMCLVEVEKAPKPLPACATPVSNGMIVRTQSEKAVQAQKSVMEFLLINHPLDCPICDQGGECQLQDLAVGYGGVTSRYKEEKRVVFFKDIGPLVSAQEMSRCIHCTRCVRFGQEIAGNMELGMANRGEHSEILSFVGNSVDSELSGNMIDLCPVGALTSKPFRYNARTWEMARRKSIAAHDSLGSNVVVQVKNDKVMRVVPQDNEGVNECWISDRDRFSYEGLDAKDRVSVPMIKKGDQWVNTDWQTALNVVMEGLKRARRESLDLNQIAFLASPNSTLEELFLLKALASGIGSTSIDSGLRHAAGLKLQGSVPSLAGSIDELANAVGVVVVGADLRNDQPLLANRIRQASKHGMPVTLITSGLNDPHIPKAKVIAAAPSDWLAALDGSDVSAALSSADGIKFVLIGQQALMAPNAAELITKAKAVADAKGARLGFLGDGANWVGGFVAGTHAASHDGLCAQGILSAPRKAVVVFGNEPEFDSLSGAKAIESLKASEFVVSVTAFVGAAKEYADVILPLCPQTETSGTFINIAGTPQTFKATVRPLGESRPGWKVLRVLGNLLQLDGFEFNSSEDVLKAALPADLASHLGSAVTATSAIAAQVLSPGLQLAAYAPIYQSDSLVRRAESLQATKAAKAPCLQANADTLKALGANAGDTVRVTDSQGGVVEAVIGLNKQVANHVILVANGRKETLNLNSRFGSVTVAVLSTAEVQA